MTKQEEIREGIKTCIAMEQSGGEFDGNRLTDKILECLQLLQVVIKVDRQLPLISKERAELAVPKTDCSGRKYTADEWEDNVRYILDGAEIQCDKDRFDSGYVAVIPLIEAK